jgi:small subunit ribosomal protein S1
VDHITHGESSPDVPPPPDEGWWEAVFRKEARRSREEPASHAGARPGEETGSPADWQWARHLYEKDELVDLPVVGYNRGGLLVQAQGMRGFVPLSHVLELCQESRLSEPPDLEGFLGRTLRLRLIEFDPERGRLVLSERAAQAAPGRRWELLRCLQPGEKVVGVVSNLTAFGAFVDLGGVEGLIHVSEISWGRVRHPADALCLGQKIEAVVLSTDPDLGRIALSLKELRPDPWTSLDGRVHLGDVVDGVVTSVVRFGAFVEIEDGVEGLLHVSELGVDSPCDPASVVREGDPLRLRVIRFEPSHRKLGLSLRAAAEGVGPSARTAPEAV